MTERTSTTPHIEPVNRHDLRIHGVLHRARVFAVRDTELALFKPAALAAALGVTTHTLRRWEKENLLPKPVYKLPQQAVRFYSKAQVLNLAQVKRLVPFSAGNYHLRDQFATLVKKVFYLTSVATIKLK